MLSLSPTHTTQSPFGPYVLSGGPLIFLEKKVCFLDTFLRESCIDKYIHDSLRNVSRIQTFFSKKIKGPPDNT